MASRTAAIIVPLPTLPRAAEAWGARAAIYLAIRTDTGGAPVRIVGDEPTVVRYCAAAGRIRSAGLHLILDDALNDLAASGRRVEWAAVRRCHNRAAHEAARRGSALALERAIAGDTAVRTVEWQA